MKRNELEPEVLYCVEKIERAIQSLYFDYKLHNNFAPQHLDFIYRIIVEEEDEEREDARPQILLLAGSTKTRQLFNIGDLEPAIEALLFLRNQLCNTALLDLQLLIHSDRFSRWHFKQCPDKSNPCPIGQRRIYNMVFCIAMGLSSRNRVHEVDIDDLSGFFIEESDVSNCIFKRLETNVDIPDSESELYDDICRAVKRLTPNSSISSFSGSKLVGKYWFGEFTPNEYHLYFDVVWLETRYVLRMVNLAGFPRGNSKQPKRVENDMEYVPWPPKKE